jgi:hypothetical protein
MVDRAPEEEGETIGIDAPHERANPKRRTVGRHELQPNYRPAPEWQLRHDLRPPRADVHGLTWMPTLAYLDQHRPGDMGAGVLSTLPLSIVRLTQ